MKTDPKPPKMTCPYHAALMLYLRLITILAAGNLLIQSIPSFVALAGGIR